MPRLATIGYEGAVIDQFLLTLGKAQIKTLVDVRELPLSRKKGFSKTSLAAHLQRAGIRYVHMRALGDPKPGRIAARSGDIDRFKEIYSRHLRSKEAKVALIQLAAIARKSNSCLLCYEYEPRNCHRQIVASRISKTFGLNIENLFVSEANIGSMNDRKAGTRRSIHSRKGPAASQLEAR